MPILYAVSLAFSAILLFLLQPVVGRMLLPVFGGAPAVWTTSVLFFQGTLLAGYLYVHGFVAALGARGQIVAHAAVVALAVASLPISLASAWDPVPDANPPPRLLAMPSNWAVELELGGRAGRAGRYPLCSFPPFVPAIRRISEVDSA